MLTFNLKKEWFEKIKSGEKTHEYREVKDYWRKRLEYQEGNERKFDVHSADFYITRERGIKKGSKILFTCGYPPKNDKNRYILAKVKNISVKNGKESDLKIDKDVYDIEFELINEHKYTAEQAIKDIKAIVEQELNTRMLFADKKSFCDFYEILQIIQKCEEVNK